MKKQKPVAWMYDWTTPEGEFVQNMTTDDSSSLHETNGEISNIRPLYIYEENKATGWRKKQIEEAEKMTDINETLAQRNQTHGDFKTHARICQDIKEMMYSNGRWSALEADQAEALEMIAHKIARILNGNPDVHDHWHDIAGYATLIANRLK